MADSRQAYPPEYLFPSYGTQRAAGAEPSTGSFARGGSVAASWPPFPPSSTKMASSASPLDSENASAGESSRGRSGTFLCFPTLDIGCRRYFHRIWNFGIGQRSVAFPSNLICYCTFPSLPLHTHHNRDNSFFRATI